MRVVPALEKFENAEAGLLRSLEAMTFQQLAFRVAKKLSHRALSKQSPTDPIEGRTPTSRQRWPKAMEVYCVP
jgi:hypothetical protein